MIWRKWILLLCLCLGMALPLAAAPPGQTVTVFFEGRKATLDGVARDDQFFYPVDKLVQVTGVRYTWNPATGALELNGTRSKVAPMLLGGQVFLPLEAFVDASGLVATWDLGRGTLLLNRASDKMPTAAQGLSTPANPGAIPDINAMPFDASLSGRLPVGWQYPSPMQEAAPPPAMPGGKPPSAAMLDRHQSGINEVYVPRSGRNGAFLVTITDVERVDNLRGYYQPKSGDRFVIVYLSQKNVSDTAQVDPGKFYLQDTGGNNYEALDELSSHRPVIFRPYGINFGYLVFEVPDVNFPTRMILTTVGQAPLSVNI